MIKINFEKFIRDRVWFGWLFLRGGIGECRSWIRIDSVHMLGYVRWIPMTTLNKFRKAIDKRLAERDD